MPPCWCRVSVAESEREGSEGGEGFRVFWGGVGLEVGSWELVVVRVGLWRWESVPCKPPASRIPALCLAWLPGIIRYPVLSVALVVAQAAGSHTWAYTFQEFPVCAAIAPGVDLRKVHMLPTALRSAVGWVLLPGQFGWKGDQHATD